MAPVEPVTQNLA
jgi:DNA methyltransferase 1-associated protein 1